MDQIAVEEEVVAVVPVEEQVEILVLVWYREELRFPEWEIMVEAPLAMERISVLRMEAEEVVPEQPEEQEIYLVIPQEEQEEQVYLIAYLALLYFMVVAAAAVLLIMVQQQEQEEVAEVVQVQKVIIQQQMVQQIPEAVEVVLEAAMRVQAPIYPGQEVPEL
jgi:hypothetical protein